MKVMIRSSDFILSEMGNHLNEIDMMCLKRKKNHSGSAGEKPQGVGTESSLEASNPGCWTRVIVKVERRGQIQDRFYR